MARPTKNTVDYFPHDAHASESDTCTVLQNLYENDGYAFWFKMLERLGATEGHVIDCGNPAKWRVFLAKMGVSEERGRAIIRTLVEVEAIDPELWNEHSMIWCENFVENLAPVYAKRKMPVPKRPSSADISATETPVTATEIEVPGPETKVTAPEKRQRKVKESKGNKSKGEESMQPPLDQGETDSLLPYLKELDKLHGWAGAPEDTVWLTEFLGEFPFLAISHIRACRDFHSNKTKNTKGLWKTRLRNWLAHERPNGGTDGRKTPTTPAANRRQSDAFADIET